MVTWKTSVENHVQHDTRPEATAIDYVVRPHSKIDADEIRAQAMQTDYHRMKVTG